MAINQHITAVPNHISVARFNSHTVSHPAQVSTSTPVYEPNVFTPKLAIEPNMIYKKQGTRDINSINWVVYEGNLRLKGSDGRRVTRDSLHIGIVQFDVFTWGINPRASTLEISKNGIGISKFGTNYYGYIEVY